MMRLYTVTDRTWVGKQSLVGQVAAMLWGGMTYAQFHERGLDEERFLREAEEIFSLYRRYRVPFFIDDNVALTLRCHADGVHVEQDNMGVAAVRRLVGQEMMMGISAHTVEEARAVAGSGTGYLGVGAMFATFTKTDANLVTKETLHAICDTVSIPVVAIGKVDKSSLLELAGASVDGIALVNAIFSAADTTAECRLLYGLSREMTELER